MAVTLCATFILCWLLAGALVRALLGQALVVELRQRTAEREAARLTRTSAERLAVEDLLFRAAAVAVAAAYACLIWRLWA